MNTKYKYEGFIYQYLVPSVYSISILLLVLST